MAKIKSGLIQIQLLECRPKLDLVARGVTAKAVVATELEIDGEASLSRYWPSVRG